MLLRGFPLNKSGSAAVLAAEPQPKVEADGKAELFRTPRGKPKNLYTEGASPSGAIR